MPKSYETKVYLGKECTELYQGLADIVGMPLPRFLRVLLQEPFVIETMKQLTEIGKGVKDTYEKETLEHND